MKRFERVSLILAIIALCILAMYMRSVALSLERIADSQAVIASPPAE